MFTEHINEDRARFIRAWLKDPLRTGAQLPSSRHLARAMAAQVDLAVPGLVVELGPGTGVVTEALIGCGVDPARLVLVESNPDFHELLHGRYRQARTLLHDAYDAPRLLRQLGATPVATIVSGLPLLTQPRWRRRRLLVECLRLGTAGARFIQFTYFHRSPIPLRSAAVATSVTPTIWRNLWPARVWTYQRAAPASSAIA
jgi:phosphatidylethanolamine/phosphatidyl-N-methylethanolamine N-methyltransferase